MADIIKNDCQSEDGGDLLIRAEGRTRFLRDRGEIKTPELIDELTSELREAREIVTGLLDFPSSPSWNIRARAFLTEKADD